jgi:ectoine hydroxylase-related dioxygenase (phytanoyl-CoA dioxygenase family)
MNMQIDPTAMRQLLPRLEARALSVDAYRKAGAFVVRGAVPSEQVAQWQLAWRTFAGQSQQRKVDPFNPVVVHEEIPAVLAEIHRCPAILDVMEQLYPDLALYQQRFVIKDAQSRTPVFLHQDYGYDHGWPEKTAVFVALSAASADNGGLILYPGTHALGYMGDTGEIDASFIGSDWPQFCPALEPGDLLLMHECTWHASGPHVQGVDRILLQVTYQPADDPTGVALLRGRATAPMQVGLVPREKIFVRSRASRLRELQAEVNAFRAAAREP